MALLQNSDCGGALLRKSREGFIVEFSVVAGGHEQTDTPPYRTRNWPTYNEALKRRGSLTIWFDPDMAWDALPTGKRGRQPIYSDAAVQTCLTMKVLFGMALRQTTGFVESLLRLIGLDWAVPDFSTLSRRQKTLAVKIPYRGSQGPLHLLIDSTGIKVEGEGEWNARKHGGAKRRVWRKIHIGIDEKTLEIRAASSPPATSAMRLCCPNCSTRSRPIRRSAASPPTAPTTPASATMPSPPAALPPSFRPARTPKPWKTDHAPVRSRATRPCGFEILRPGHLATMERIPPPKPRRNQDALCQAAGPAPHGAGLRPSGRGVPGPCRRPERLHRARHPRHGGRGISLSGERGTSAISRFVQQGLIDGRHVTTRPNDSRIVLTRPNCLLISLLTGNVLISKFMSAFQRSFPAHSQATAGFRYNPGRRQPLCHGQRNFIPEGPIWCLATSGLHLEPTESSAGKGRTRDPWTPNREPRKDAVSLMATPTGEILALGEGISFWGGIDPDTGKGHRRASPEPWCFGRWERSS